MQEMDLTDYPDAVSGIESHIDENTFDADPALDSMSIRCLFKNLDQKVAPSRLGKQIFDLTGARSAKTWERLAKKVSNTRQPLKSMPWLFSGADWEGFLDSDVVEPMWPSRQKRPAETRTPQQKAEGNKRPCFTPAGAHIAYPLRI
jgi:hypothetical protein